jgi:HEAT repeat protein
MLGTGFNLDKIRPDLASDNQSIRGRAMNQLLDQVQKDPGIHAECLGIFQSCLDSQRDPWSVTWGIRGIEIISGADAGKRAKLALFSHSSPYIVAGVVGTIDDPSYIQPLIKLLAERSEETIRVMTIRVLGRLRDGSALAALLQYLPDKNLRPHIVEALGELGDARAIPYL